MMNRPTSKQLITHLIAVLIGVGVGIAGGSSGTSSQRSVHTVSGTIAVNQDRGYKPGEVCTTALDGYQDIAVGSQVTVRDESGVILGVGQLSAGVAEKWGDSLHRCRFPFSVTGIGEARVYSVEVAHRGEVNMPVAQLLADRWTVELSV